MSNASSEEIESFSAYEGEEDRNIDATIILGDYVESAIVPQPEYVLILMRFHKLSRHSNIKPGVSAQLYKEIMKVCGKSGFDVVRTGGSSGPSVASSDFFDFVNVSTSFPLKGKAVKFYKGEGWWDCFYVSRTIKETNDIGDGDGSVLPTRKITDDVGDGHGSIVHYRYAQPQVGGSFRFPSQLYTEFPFLIQFTVAKATAAILLQKLNDNQMLTRQRNVQSVAVRNDMLKVQFGNDFAKCFPDEDPELSFVRGYNCFCSWTIVTHPVGRHQDTFGNKTASLENKICFVHDYITGMGRGGKGKTNKYVFALLDWAAGRSERRRFVVEYTRDDTIRVTNDY